MGELSGQFSYVRGKKYVSNPSTMFPIQLWEMRPSHVYMGFLFFRPEAGGQEGHVVPRGGPEALLSAIMSQAAGQEASGIHRSTHTTHGYRYLPPLSPPSTQLTRGGGWGGGDKGGEGVKQNQWSRIPISPSSSCLTVDHKTVRGLISYPPRFRQVSFF